MEILNENYKRTRENFLFNDHLRLDLESQRLKMSVRIKDDFEAPTVQKKKFRDIQESNALIKRDATVAETPKISNSLVKIKKERQLQKPSWHPPWKLFRVISGHLGWVRSVSVDVGNEWFATGAGDRMIKIWDLATGTLKLSLTGHINTVRGLAISPRHPYLFSAGEDKMVKCWDLETNKVIRHYHGHLSGVFCLDIHPTLDVIVTGGRDSCARVIIFILKKGMGYTYKISNFCVNWTSIYSRMC